MFNRATTLRIIIAASAASFGAALAYSAAGLVNLRSAVMPSEGLIWVLLVSALTLPVTLLSSALASLLAGFSGYLKFATATMAVLLIPCASAFAFIGYMDSLAPATNWQRGWWLPVVASIASIILTWAIARRTRAPLNVS